MPLVRGLEMGGCHLMTLVCLIPSWRDESGGVKGPGLTTWSFQWQVSKEQRLKMEASRRVVALEHLHLFGENAGDCLAQQLGLESMAFCCVGKSAHLTDGACSIAAGGMARETKKCSHWSSVAVGVAAAAVAVVAVAAVEELETGC
jgi:hypothetical protein